jgi:FkbM family methyltransferase
MSLTQTAKTFLRKLGLDVHRFRPQASEDARLIAMLAAHDVNLVLDVGANEGQFGQLLRSGGYRGRIVSFEPLTQPRRRLAQLSRRDPSWTVAEQAAIGAEMGEIEIHIARNSVSSSALAMLNAHSAAAPQAQYESSERVALRTLDSVAAAYIDGSTTPFLKIDTQGFEDRVLRGAQDVLQKTVGVQLELSLVPLYEGQVRYEELMERLKNAGFDLWAVSPAFVHPRTGRHLQVDATFFRSAAG